MVFCKVVLLIVFGSCLVSATHNYDPLKYSVPQPLIQAFRPRGLKVSIPHTTGIQLFAFHGNINKPLHGTLAGQLSQDILHRDGDHWIFSDPTVELEIGDKIYYWMSSSKITLATDTTMECTRLKVKITFHSVEGCNNDSHATVDERTTTMTTTEISNPEKFDLNLRICEKVLLNLTQTMLNLQHEIDSFRETNYILRDLVGKHYDTSTTLTLDGPLPNDDDIFLLVQAIINEKLGLSIRAQSVDKKKKGRVRFRVATLDDKITIIKAAKEKLRHSKFAILY
ncbi:beta-1,3-glucan-binding protein 2 [Asbolus verrucosus]|uniref:Beta-1,3-glucan-binding protein 2 n=1 Tax=Asbolus verrucosus TaxID=1661398 RepID=A0A482W7Y6_ASBVE|nr:beta-1,3-glucan-binding protein 2 [Asbolus verrucosus]